MKKTLFLIGEFVCLLSSIFAIAAGNINSVSVLLALAILLKLDAQAAA